jgi:hypothetical protein
MLVALNKVVGQEFGKDRVAFVGSVRISGHRQRAVRVRWQRGPQD